MIETNNNSPAIFNANFSDLDSETRRALYQKANETHNVGLIRQLNDIGMKPTYSEVIGPSIVSYNMDIATKYDKIHDFLKDLRETNRLLTKKEFQRLSKREWINKGDRLSRIMGVDHLMKKIKENNLHYVKVPSKIAIVEDDCDSLNVEGFNYGKNHYNFYSKQLKVYAERITPVDRKLSRDEIDELIQVIASANFVDLWPQNIVVTEDGMYFIDTELNSFAGHVPWEKLLRFEPLIKDEDQEYFKNKVQLKFEQKPKRQEESGYNSLNCNLKIYEKLEEPLKVKYINRINELKAKISDLEYMGLAKVGDHWMSPNKFSFDIKEIIQ